MDKNKQLDRPAFFTAIFIILFVCISLASSPDKASAFLEKTYNYIANQIGVIFVFSAVGANIFLIWLSLSKYGNVKFGSEDSTPEFDTLSWISMLFCAGIGGGLIYWCGVEWAHYYQSPPFGAEPFSPEAAEWASTYGLFHWGFPAWAFYCLAALVIGYPYYSKNLGRMRFSNGCHYFLSDNIDGLISRFIDFLFIVAMVGGAAASLGFSTPMIATCLAWIFGLENNFSLEVIVTLICVVLMSISVFLGLRKGIRVLSHINLIIGFLLLLFILIVGPTSFLLKTSINSVGVLIQNAIKMTFWTDPFTESRFVEDWTVFYWAWWVAFSPYVGMFIARISHGRSIKQMILGMLIFGSLGCWVFYMIIGNYSLFLELENIVSITQVLNEKSQSDAIVATLQELPLPGMVITIFSIMAIIFATTTYDSAAYTIASSATKNLTTGSHPARWHRVFWALALGVLPITLLYIGGLRVMQLVLLIVSVPILLLGIIMAVSLLRSLREDH